MTRFLDSVTTCGSGNEQSVVAMAQYKRNGNECRQMGTLHDKRSVV